MSIHDDAGWHVTVWHEDEDMTMSVFFSADEDKADAVYEKLSAKFINAAWDMIEGNRRDIPRADDAGYWMNRI